MYKYSYRIAIGAVLVLISSISIFSQKHSHPKRPQIIEGCSPAISNYPPPPDPAALIYKDEPYTNGEQIPVDHVETGFSRFIFTFSPDKGRYTPGDRYNPQGDTITFSVFNYGKQENSFHREPSPPAINPGQTEESYRLNRPSPLARLDLERRSTLREEGYGILNWDETYLKTMASSGPWYAIYSYAGPLDGPRPDNGIYLSPIPAGQLPSDSGDMKVWPNPKNYYSYEGYPGKPSPGDGIMSTVRRLSSGLDIDVTGWKEGYYWFTLQNEADFGGQKCQKTTPPVLIEIRKPPPPTVNHAPTISVKASSTPCKSVSATATVYDPDVPPQTLTVKWTITDQNKHVVNPDYISPDGTIVRIDTNLKTGRYKFEATVTDSDPYDPLSASDSDETDYICGRGGAGVAYFQFAVPFPEEKNIPLDTTAPETWTGGDPKLEENPGNPYSMPYPKKHFLLFFRQTATQDPSPDLTKSNTNMLNHIVDMLDLYPTYKLKIFGYADFKKTGNYDNKKLGWRRVNTVISYLIHRHKELNPGSDENEFRARLFGDIIIAKDSFGDSKTQTCDPNNWAQERRWDRRTEIMYMAPENQNVLPPTYEKQECPKYMAPAEIKTYKRKPVKPKKRR